MVTAELKKAVKAFREKPIVRMRTYWPDMKTWPGMVAVVNSVNDYWRTVVPACHESSKTFTAARIAVDWMRQEGIVVTTAPTFYQIAALLWGKMRQAYNTAAYDFGGEFLPSKPFWKISEEYYAVGVSPKQPENIQGHHCPSRRVLGIIDEASGVRDAIHEAFDSIITDPETTRELKIGNPIRRTGRFAKDIKDPRYHKVHLDGHDVVKWSKLIPGLISRGYIDDQYARYLKGENPLYLPRVRGLVPEQDIDAFLGVQDWDRMLAAELNYELYEPHMAIDWSQGGICETVFSSWQGYKRLDYEAFSGKLPDDTIGRAVAFAVKFKVKKVFHDACGVGKTMGPLLRKVLAPLGIEVADIDSSAVGEHMMAPKKPCPLNIEEYGNQRCLIWGYLQWASREGYVQMTPDKDGTEKTKDQLLAQTFYRNVRGQKFALSKNEMRSDLGMEQMDRADNTIYGVYGAQFMPRGVPRYMPNRQRQNPAAENWESA